MLQINSFHPSAMLSNCKKPLPVLALTGRIGDLLFAITNLARHLDVDPEQAIEQCNQKFLRRFQFIETQIIQQGKSLQTASLDELDGLWDKAKLTEKKD